MQTRLEAYDYRVYQEGDTVRVLNFLLDEL